MKKITLKCFLNENPKLFADTQPNEGPTFAHVADLLLEDVVAALVHVRAQKVLEAVVDLQAGGGHGHPLPHRVTLTRKRIPRGSPHSVVLPDGLIFRFHSTPGSYCPRASSIFHHLLIFIQSLTQ